MSFPHYAEYKDSGIDWLGEVPGHWGVKRVRFVARLNPSKGETAALARNEEISFLPMEAIGDDGVLDLERSRPIGDVETGYTYFREGDVTIAKITPCFENGKGAVMSGLIGGIGFGTTELIVARPLPDETTSVFLHWLFVSAPFRKLGEAAMYGAGGQKRVPDDFVRDFAMGFPSVSEQSAIAAFLDRQTAKIDALVVEQEKLIALLAEKRQAVISHAVTKGLNSAAAMKDSGVEWLGEVPEHWEIGAIKRFFSILDSRRVPLSAEERGGRSGEFPYYGASGIIDWIDEFIFDEDLILVSEDGANLLSRTTPIAFVASGQYWVNNHAHILKPLDDVVTYWAERIESIDLTPFITGSAQPKLTIDALANLPIAVPPSTEERQLIAAYIIKETARFDSLTAEARRAIALLKEHRSALISAAVTGKIDVRRLVKAEAA
ncbi:MAG: restriction endonuclease subunit S [Rhodospirillales bacterium]|nr:restriction endonuclease subunit S [Rhodospirillales bacterium]